jgi:hypothetical protein
MTDARTPKEAMHHIWVLSTCLRAAANLESEDLAYVISEKDGVQVVVHPWGGFAFTIKAPPISREQAQDVMGFMAMFEADLAGKNNAQLNGLWEEYGGDAVYQRVCELALDFHSSRSMAEA